VSAGYDWVLVSSLPSSLLPTLPPSLLQLSPENAEEYIEYLTSINRLDEAAVKLAEIVNKVGQPKQSNSGTDLS